MATDATGKFALGLYDQLSGANRLQENNNPNRDAITSGVTGGENLIAYEVGRRVGDELQNLGKDINKVREDLWKDRPKFELPEIKIPEFERPEIPKYELPELPEFKIPEFKFPEPRDKDKPAIEPLPEPTDLTRKLRELELSPCGSISFNVGYSFKITEHRYVPNENGNGGYIEKVGSYVSPEEAFSTYKKWFPNGYQKISDFLEGGGGSGSFTIKTLSDLSSYKIADTGGTLVNEDGTEAGGVFGRLTFPYYSSFSSVIEVRGLTTNTAINAILDDLSNPYVFRISVSQPTADGCPIGKPTPAEPPPPPKKKMCCPEIPPVDYRRIKAMIDEAISKLDLVAAIPMSWQIRNEGNKPQLVIQCAEENGVDKDGNKKYKSAMYPISVPHWDGTPSDKISLPSYIKGNYEGIYTLNDNSKVTINAQNEVECKRILNAIKPHIPKQYTTDAYFKGGMIVRDKPIKESRVKPRYGRYFKDGQKNNKPDWRVDFT